MSYGQYKLTEGALKTIMNGGEVSNPIIQLLSSKKMNMAQSEKQRMRLLVSDGKYSISSAMLMVPASDKRDFENLSIIQVKKCITSVINNTKADKGDTRILLILDLEILVPGSQVGEKLGSPSILTDVPTGNSTTNNNEPPKNTEIPQKSSSSNSTVGGKTTMDTSTSSLNTHMVHPISSLSPYHNKWVIKARVTNKSAIRTWSNSRGEGKLFSMDLIDESGEIRCTAFRDMVDKYYDYIQIDKVYYISKCQLKPANKQFSTLKNDYEMTMGNETIIEECNDTDSDSIPQTKYDFINIDKVASIEVGTLIDIIGVAKNTSDLVTFQAKTTGRELKKKEVTLVDQSNTAVALTLWGSDADSFDGTNNPIVAIKGAKVGEFGGGKSISMVSGSLLKVNPEIKECYLLRTWYDNEGRSMEVANISARTGGGSFQTNWLSFKQVTDMGLGKSEKGDYYQVLATVLLVRSENAMYKACPTPECNKKIIDMENGMYRCEKCNREYPSYKWRLLASMNLGDWSGNQWVSMFSQEAEKVLGMTAEEIGQEVEQNPNAVKEIVDRAHFKQFVMKCRAKMETYNDESRLKTVAVNVQPVNFEEHNAYLLNSINQLLNL